jgi:serine/threonine-protein kinase
VVPDIKPGTSVQQAERAIRQVQLAPRHDSSADRYSDTVPKGAVLAVSPKPGSQANIGDPVKLIVSKGPAPTPVPSVVGKTKEEAFQALRNAGFEPFDAGAEFSGDVPGGRVTRTEPATGSTIGKGQRVGVYVSNAVEVPTVIGRPASVAVRALAEAGLKPGGDRGRGRFSFVVGQDPMPGTLVKPGSTVNLTTVP